MLLPALCASLKGFKGFRKLSLYSDLGLIVNIKQHKAVNKQVLGSGKWESKSAFIRFYKAVLKVYKPWPLSQGLEGTLWNIWREEKGKYTGFGGKSVTQRKTTWNYPLQRCDFLPHPPTCLHTCFGVLHPSHFPVRPLYVGHYLQICILSLCLSSFADTRYSSH